SASSPPKPGASMSRSGGLTTPCGPRPRPATPPHAPRHCGHPSRLPGLHRREGRPRCPPNRPAYYRTDGHYRRSSRPNGPLFGGLLERKNVVETHVTEIAPDIYRLSTYNIDANFMFNQFLVLDEEPLLFQTGLRSLFPLVSEAVRRLIPVDQLRWITFGHVEADECGSMNQWLAAAPNAEVAHGAVGCLVSVNDLADRPPRPLQSDEVMELGAKRMRRIETPHVPHGWDAGLFYEETTSTLLCGDLF